MSIPKNSGHRRQRFLLAGTSHFGKIGSTSESCFGPHQLYEAWFSFASVLADADDGKGFLRGFGE